MTKTIRNNGVVQRSRKRKNKLNYCTKTKNNYCHICCKYFTTKSSHLNHMSTYHDEAETFKYPCSTSLFKSAYKTTNKKYWFNPTDIFIECFEDEMTFDFKSGNDKFRCLSCHYNFTNVTEYLKHEIIHYCNSSVNNNVHSTQEPSFHENSDSLLVDNFSGISCILCRCTFTSMSAFDQHKNEDCKYDEDINLGNSLNCGDINTNIKQENSDITIEETAQNIKQEDIEMTIAADIAQNIKQEEERDQEIDEERNQEEEEEEEEEVEYVGSVQMEFEENVQKEYDEIKNIKKEIDEVIIESKVKLKLVPQQFNCFICKQMCECLEHLEIHKWWSESDTQVEFRLFECYVCNEQFTEEKEFKIHETNHVLRNIC